MGMAVVGRKPSAEAGKYFRNNVWWWRPLADYCCQIAPSVTSGCEYWQSNDGDGLNAAGATALADALEREITAGRTAEYAGRYEAKRACTPKPPCQFCEGTGVRRDLVGISNGFHLREIPTTDASHPRAGEVGWCNGCHGTGFDDPPSYPFSVENVQAFISFLRASGGFRIH
jgi:hypothetical protein